MHVLPSQMHYLALRGAHNKQKRTALQMLALSGVVRPSHVELRFPTYRRQYPLSRATNCNRTSADPT